MATMGGLAGLGGFDPGDLMAALGQSLLTSPRTNPLQGLPAGIAAVNARSDKQLETDAMVMALRRAGFDLPTATALARNPQAAALSISTDNAAKSRGLAEKVIGEVDSILPPVSGAAPGPQPRVGGLSGLGGMSPPAGGGGNIPNNPTAKAIYEGVISRGGSPTLAAAVVGNFGAESSFNARAEGDHNIGGVSGPTAFGFGQWRLDRAQALRQLGQQTNRDPFDVNNQLDHLFNEFKGGDAGAARAFAQINQPGVTPEQASEIFARHFERPSQKALAESLGRRTSGALAAMNAFGSGGPVQVADASTRVPMPTPDRTTGSDPTTPVMQRQTLETQPAPGGAGGAAGLDAGSFYRIQLAAKSNPNTPVNQLLGPATLQANPGLFTGPDGSPLTASAALARLTTSGAPVSTAGAQPAPGITTAQADDLPRGQVAANGGKIPVPLGNLGDLKPIPPKPDVAPDTTTMRAWARSAYSRGLKLTIAGGAMGEGGKGYIEAGKAAMDLAREHLKPTEIEKTLEAAGIDPASPQGRTLLVASADKRSDVVKNAEIAYPGDPNRVRQAVRNSLPDSRPEIVRTGQAAQDTPGLVNSGLEVEARRKQADAAATTTGTKTAEAAVAAPAALDRANAALATIDKLRKHPSRQFATGFSGVLPRIPGSGQADFIDLLGQAKGGAFLQAFESLKGGGAISENEGTKAEQAVARLSRTQTEEGFLEALNDLESVIRSGMARSQRASGGAASGSSPGSMTTPYGTIRQIR